MLARGLCTTAGVAALLQSLHLAACCCLCVLERSGRHGRLVCWLVPASHTLPAVDVR